MFILLLRQLFFIIMKKFKLLIPLLLCCSFSIRAESENSSSPTSVYLKYKSPKDNNRPLAPSRQKILCILENKHISFSFAYPEGKSELFICEIKNGTTHFYNFDSENLLSIYVGDISDSVITIITESGNEYEGIINL